MDDSDQQPSKTMRRIKNAGTIAQTARRALKLALLLKDVINVEKKEWPDTPCPGSTVTTTAAMFCINKIAEGADYTDRTGRSIKLSHLTLKGAFTKHTSSTQTIHRVIVFVDNAYDGATPSSADLLLGTPLYNADRNPDPNLRARYRVLCDKRWWLNASQSVQLFDWSQSVKHHILFDGAAATDLGHGSIWVCSVSSEATNGTFCELESRLHFVDN